MTEKQEKIINAALELFAEEGYRNTSTSKVAKKAGVSEGLIFRHFKNKEGLLAAIVEEGEIRAKELFMSILSETDPKEIIRKTLQIGLALEADQDAANFWKLQYKIKWEMELYAEHKMQDLQTKLSDAFTALRYKNPEQEALLLLINMDGIATRFFLQKSFELKPMIQFLTNKYGL